MLNGAMVDPEIMRVTLLRVMKNWDWKNTWGWDYPMVAMTAARLGESDRCRSVRDRRFSIEWSAVPVAIWEGPVAASTKQGRCSYAYAMSCHLLEHHKRSLAFLRSAQPMVVQWRDLTIYSCARPTPRLSS